MDAESTKLIGAGLAAIGMIGSGIGIGNIFSSLMNGISRNPSTEKSLLTKAFIGAAFAEAIAIFALVIALIILFV